MQRAPRAIAMPEVSVARRPQAAPPPRPPTPSSCLRNVFYTRWFLLHGDFDAWADDGKGLVRIMETADHHMPCMTSPRRDSRLKLMRSWDQFRSRKRCPLNGMGEGLQDIPGIGLCSVVGRWATLQGSAAPPGWSARIIPQGYGRIVEEYLFAANPNHDLIPEMGSRRSKPIDGGSQI
jgi:hypothetical protein